MRSISLVLFYRIISSAAGALPASSISLTGAPSAILDVQEATFDNFLGSLPPPEVSKSAALNWRHHRDLSRRCLMGYIFVAGMLYCRRG
jgi:hypothetical protein